MSLSSKTRNRWKLVCASDEIPGFNDLFPEGVAWPGTHPLQTLLVGPEGSGKTTLAIELALCSDIVKIDDAVTPAKRCVAYFTTDNVLDRVNEKIEVFGLPHAFARGERNLIVCGPDDPRFNRQDETRYNLGKNEVLLCLERLTSSDPDGKFHTTSVLQDIGNRLKWLRTRCNADNYFLVLDSIAAIKDAKDCFGYFMGQSDLPDPDDLPHPAVIIITNESDAKLARSPYLSDLVIYVSQATHDEAVEQGFCDRYIQVVKAANCRHARGIHTFHIVSGFGAEIWPSPQLQVDIINRDRDRDAAGKVPEVYSLDRGNRDAVPQQMDFGVPGTRACGLRLAKGSITYLTGPAGTLKTPQAMYFIAQELNAGPAVYISLSENTVALASFLRSVGVSPDNTLVICSETLDPKQINDEIHKAASQSGRTKQGPLLMIHASHYFVSAATALTFVRRILEILETESGRQVTRFVLDGLNQIEKQYPRLAKEPTFLPLLAALLRAHGCTSLFAAESVPSHESFGESNMRHLADNVIATDSLGAERTVLLNVERLGDMPVRELPIIELAREQPRRGGKRRIEAKNAKEHYVRTETGRLVPARVLLCLNSFAPSHTRFNMTIQQGFSSAADLDETTTRHRGANFLWELDMLKLKEDIAVVLAVDDACMGDRDYVLERFVDLRPRWSSRGLGKFLDAATERCTLGTSVRLLPACIDHSVVLFYPEQIDKIKGGSIPESVLRLKRRICESAEPGELPMVPTEDFVQAAEDWGDKELLVEENTAIRFFTFHGGRDIEHMVGLLLEWLRASNTGAVNCAGKLQVVPTDWAKALVNLARAYLAGWKWCPPVPANGEVSKKSRRRCPSLFHRTWHSIAFSDPASERAVPIHIGENWRATRGGWYWGVLDTGAGGEIAGKVLDFALSPQMAVHKIAQHIYLPANKDLLSQDDGENSIYNARLMRDEYINACSRADIDEYRRVSPYFYNFFVSFLDLLSRTSERPDRFSSDAVQRMTDLLHDRLSALKKIVEDPAYL